MAIENRTPRDGRVDARQVKLEVGLIAILLPVITTYSALPGRITSISESYWQGGPTQALFVGGLFAIAALMLAYDGVDQKEARASKFGALCAILVALYPCVCERDGSRELIKGAHAAAAALLYCVLAYFCLRFMQRAKEKSTPESGRRHTAYAVCLSALTIAMLMLSAQNLGKPVCFAYFGFLACDRYVWFWESVGLEAFGFAWFTASHLLPWFNAPHERFAAFRSVRASDAPDGPRTSPGKAA